MDEATGRRRGWLLTSSVVWDGRPGCGDTVTTAAGALAAAAHFRRAAAGLDALLRFQDTRHAGRWADVASCEWGMAMLWNDGEGSGGDSFGTLGDAATAEARPFPQPGGDDLLLPRGWFVPAGTVLRAVAVYVETGRL